MTRAAALIACLGLSLGACGTTEPEPALLTAAHEAADALYERAEDRIPPDGPIVYTPFLPVGRLADPNPIGHLLAEHIATRLVQRGLTVVEVRLREDIAVRPGGPFVLSDDARDVARRVLAKAALVGSYAAASDRILLTLRLVDLDTGIVLAAQDAAIPARLNHRTLINEQALIVYDGGE